MARRAARHSSGPYHDFICDDAEVMIPGQIAMLDGTTGLARIAVDNDDTGAYLGIIMLDQTEVDGERVKIDIGGGIWQAEWSNPTSYDSTLVGLDAYMVDGETAAEQASTTDEIYVGKVVGLVYDEFGVATGDVLVQTTKYQ